MIELALAMVAQAAISNRAYFEEQAKYYGPPIPSDHPWRVEERRQADAEVETARMQMAAFRDQMLSGYAAAIALSPELEPVRRSAMESLGRMYREWKV